MDLNNFFELNTWNLTGSLVREYAQASFNQDPVALSRLSRPSEWPSNLVDPCHLFACGVSTGGGLFAARKALEHILEQGGNLDVVDSSSWVPLSYASWFGHAGTLDLLLEAGAAVHPQNSPPPLDIALSSLAQSKKSGAATCAKLLLMHGADPRSGNHVDMMSGRSSHLSWSLSVDNLELANLLWLHGDRLRGDREFSLVSWKAGVDSLDWLQQHDYNVINLLPTSHPHRQDLIKAQALRDLSALEVLLPEHLRSGNQSGAASSGSSSLF